MNESQRRGSPNATWCGNYNVETALRQLPNPTIWDPESLGYASFGQAPDQCAISGDGGDGGGADGKEGTMFGLGFLAGAGSILLILAVLIGAFALLVYYRRRQQYTVLAV